VRIGLVILPTDPWHTARRQWEWADDVGFSTAWTYDHIRWGGMPDGPWYGAAIPVLAAAAVVTRRTRLGTLVATPNFRHPVTLARDALTLDDLSHGRFDLGLGPGSQGHDASALGQDPWAPSERLARFQSFLLVLAPILEGGHGTRTTLRTTHYAAVGAPSTPGSVQQPLPLTVAAGGPRGLRLAALYGRNWVTVGPTSGVPHTPESVLEAARRQVPLLDAACGTVGRDPATLGRVMLWMPYEPRITSADQFEEIVAPYAELGFDQFVLHHPDQTGPFGGDVKAFEEIAARYSES
jgi:alkanesulfonate monooxygenase SsuD/methylene tetrahydromethanopterin reductase-like flavin-dependent oxidoreductase (luciferase family)